MIAYTALVFIGVITASSWHTVLAEECETMANTDLDGKFLLRPEVESMGECCMLCGNTTGCMAWTYYPRLSRCTFLSGVGDRYTYNGIWSGVRPAAGGRITVLFDTHLYSINPNQEYTREQAKEMCKADGGYLVAIDSAEESDFLKKYSLNVAHLWIGLNDIATEGYYKWEDGSTLTYSSWQSESPNKYRNEDCVHLHKDTGEWSDKKCNRRLGYICENGEGEYFDTITEFFNGNYYHINQNWDYTREQANEKCEADGAHLVKIDNTEESEFLKKYSMKVAPLWIGLTDLVTEGQHMWDDGTPLTYSSWGSWGSRNDDDSDCVLLKYATGDTWAYDVCVQRAGYICEKRAIGGDYDAQTTVYNGHLYLINQKPVYTRTQAKEKCKAEGAELVKIDNAEESEFLKKYSLNVAHLWIGLNDLAEEGQYKWEDGTPLAYSSWQSGSPNNYRNQDCVHLHQDTGDTWGDKKCNRRLGYICEMVIPP